MTTLHPAADPHGSDFWSPPMPDAPGFDHVMVETPGLHTHVAGIGEGDPVLLLHGFPEHWWQWREVAPLIAAQGYRVVCPDLRGAGWTVAEDPAIDRATRLRDVVALMDALDIERAHVVSHDMGSITALQLTYEQPERVRTAVQLAVPPFYMRFHPRVAPGFRHLPLFIWHRPGASLARIFSDAYVAHPMTDATIEAHLAPMRRREVDAAVRPLTRRMVLPEAMRMLMGVYRRRRLTVPTLVVFGRGDYPWSEDLLRSVCRGSERYADRLELAFVEDAKHFITDDAPEEVARLTVDWLRGAEGGDGR